MIARAGATARHTQETTGRAIGESPCGGVGGLCARAPGRGAAHRGGSGGGGGGRCEAPVCSSTTGRGREAELPGGGSDACRTDVRSTLRPGQMAVHRHFSEQARPAPEPAGAGDRDGQPITCSLAAGPVAHIREDLYWFQGWCPAYLLGGICKAASAEDASALVRLRPKALQLGPPPGARAQGLKGAPTSQLGGGTDFTSWCSRPRPLPGASAAAH